MDSYPHGPQANATLAKLPRYSNRDYGRRPVWGSNAVSRSNPGLQSFYWRLIERCKPHEVALVAAMRKPLAAIYSVAKHRRAFVPFIICVRRSEKEKD
jgi:transposase